PPGPYPLPLVGNLFDLLNVNGAWDVFLEWKTKYGDIVGLRALGYNVVVLNSLRAFDDLLNKRGDNYSHRPNLTVVRELMDFGHIIPLRDCDEEWRKMRKILHNVLGPQPVKQYYILQEDAAATFVAHVIKDPENYRDFLRAYVKALRLIRKRTRLYQAFRHAEDTMKLVRDSILVGANVADIIPAMKYLPTWLPFHRRAAHGREMIHKMVFPPYEQVEIEMAEGKARPSLVRDMLARNGLKGPPGKKERDRTLWTAGIYATILTFILAMVLNPDKQEAAQAEIDNVLGVGQLPVLRDRGRLPYIDSVLKETMRWHPMIPLGFPRRTSQADEYSGYSIPANTVILMNVWSIAFEADTMYPPREFHPERFLDKDHPVVDTASWAFGFGRRICPGKLLAENTLFILMSTILTVFKLTPTENFKMPDFVTDMGSYPGPFDCHFTPRSPMVEETVRQR
ncbi:cytochrome P450, partial [Vararia minispora EC-137]